MSVRLTLRDQTSTGRETGTVELDDIPTALTLRDLIRTRVREEVARHNAGADKTWSGLVTPERAVQTPAGLELRTRARRVDWEKQADVAIAAFERNGFFVIVDDRQVTELDEELALTGTSDVRFVRLVALIGG